MSGVIFSSSLRPGLLAKTYTCEREFPPLPLTAGEGPGRGPLPHRHQVNGCFPPQGVAWRELPPQNAFFQQLTCPSWPHGTGQEAKRGRSKA
jgi:hypothetical protein